MAWSREGWPEVVPGMHGEVYYYDVEKDDLQLVVNDEIMSPEGTIHALMLSFRETKAMYIDRCTGRVLRVLSYHGGESRFHATPGFILLLHAILRFSSRFVVPLSLPLPTLRKSTRLHLGFFWLFDHHCTETR